ncbi:MAG: sugar ABC transporter substrate-binding protein [Bacillaceae bacterium G1]|nr:MAG: sugar ABC transporter substrate-binding protein [Bacillaceae bacterium G1]
MTQKRWGIWLAVGLVLALMLAACGGGNTPASTEPSGQEQEQSSQDNGAASGNEAFKIGIAQLVEHPSLDAAREGFIQALLDHGFSESNIDVKLAQGDPNTNTTIAQSFVADKKDLVLAIATSTAQAMVKEAEAVGMPVLFTAITDPLGANLVSDLEKPGKNVTGTSDTHPDAIPLLMQFIKDEFPDVQTVGIIYNAGEQNAVVNVTRAKEELTKLGLKTEEVTVATMAEVKQAAESLIGRVDAIYVPKDNTVVAALESVLQVGIEQKIPVFAGETDSVERGALASYGLDYFQLGYKTGMMAVDILQNGVNPGDIPVGYPDDLGLVINADAAAKMGVTITDSMRSKAEAVINE